MKLSMLLSKAFDPAELKVINSRWKNRDVELVKVEDISAFLDDCRLESEAFKKSGPHRLSDWEDGWSGSGVTNEFAEFPNIPYYFKKNTHVRVGNEVYFDKSGLTELCFLRCIQDVAFGSSIINDDSAIIEYGCGTGHNLSYLKGLYNFSLFGADWAQSAVAKLIENNIVKAGRAFNVNYFDEHTFTGPSIDFWAFTNASLEQTGSEYKAFMNYLFKNDLCRGGIHIEPISDLVANNSELNDFSIAYSKKRGYLDGFYEFLCSSNVNIHLAKDYGLGSKFISGYQLLIWAK